MSSVLISGVRAIDLRRHAVEFETVNTGWKRLFRVDEEDLKHLKDLDYKLARFSVYAGKVKA
jgi:hypothetical protein